MFRNYFNLHEYNNLFMKAENKMLLYFLIEVFVVLSDITRCIGKKLIKIWHMRHSLN